MLEFISTHLPSLLAILSSSLAIVAGVIVLMVKKTGNKSLEPIANVFTKISKMLPGLITFSETMNSGQPGEVKKDFVMNYIKQTFSMMNVELDEQTLSDVSEAIDSIVKATKQMHTTASTRVVR